MNKVVIVDDESIIVEGLTKTLPWEQWNCKIVATASDGEEGRKIIGQYHPDLVFSDIAMPGVDGLKMIAGLKSEFPDMEISILTGYRDFEYAQEAVRLGVRRFLLKPSSMKEIEEAVEAMVQGLGKKAAISKAEGPKEKCDMANSFIVKNAMRYIENHYTERLTLLEVAEQTYVSPWHLSKLLNKHTGHSFSELLNRTRIAKAQELLKEQSLRIGDIAEQVGFLDMAHFSRVFKKIVGMSANEYRNMMS